MTIITMKNSTYTPFLHLWGCCRCRCRCRCRSCWSVAGNSMCATWGWLGLCWEWAAVSSSSSSPSTSSTLSLLPGYYCLNQSWSRPYTDLNFLIKYWFFVFVFMFMILMPSFARIVQIWTCTVSSSTGSNTVSILSSMLREASSTGEKHQLCWSKKQP